MSDDVLKRCPFCGNPPVILTTREDDSFERCAEVRCDTCGIALGDEYRADAIQLWNTRATLTASRSYSDEIEGAVKAVAQIEMDREGYPLSRTQQEIYDDATETVEAVLAALSRPNVDAGVTQADRDAAATMWRDIEGCSSPDSWQAQCMEDGTADHGPVVQALRAHRVSALSKVKDQV